MNRPFTILLVGLLLAAGGFGLCYWRGTASHQQLLRSATPELAWLKQEFNLSEADYQRILDLHDAYLPHCAEMCRRIAVKTGELKILLQQTNALTPEIEGKMAEASQLRLECQTAMLRHFFAVSRAMPSEQGRRYLTWVQGRTLLNGGMMAERHGDHE